MLEELEFLKRKTNEITRERDSLKEFNALHK
jgi:hypothetical protein